MMTQIGEAPKQTDREQLENLPSSTLFDLARNEAARWAARKVAVALLMDRADHRTKHNELAVLVQHVAKEIMSGETIPEPATSPESGLPLGAVKFLSFVDGLETRDHLDRLAEGIDAEPASNTGPFSASITTASLFGSGEPSDLGNMDPLPTATPTPKSGS